MARIVAGYFKVSRLPQACLVHLTQSPVLAAHIIAALLAIYLRRLLLHCRCNVGCMQATDGNSQGQGTLRRLAKQISRQAQTNALQANFRSPWAGDSRYALFLHPPWV